uniref:Uncharacterized protein n=1 Tax=viral metagenome TaxID=1070528 RepID=A0A6C0IK02_9ZZZZ
MHYSNQLPIIQEDANMPVLAENDSDEEYADMPPLVPVEVLNDNLEDDEMPELMPALVAGPNVSELADQFINNLQIGDTFKTSANYHVIYQGKREDEELYDFQILDLNSGQTYDTHYSKLGTYVSMGLHEKVNAPSG